MNITIEVGHRIRYFRKQKELSQGQLALQSGLHNSYIGQVERGEKIPSIDTLYKVTKGMNISLTKLFEGIDEVAAEQTDNYAYKGYQLMMKQSPEKQEKIYNILEQITNLSDK